MSACGCISFNLRTTPPIFTKFATNVILFVITPLPYFNFLEFVIRFWTREIVGGKGTTGHYCRVRKRRITIGIERIYSFCYRNVSAEFKITTWRPCEFIGSLGLAAITTKTFDLGMWNLIRIYVLDMPMLCARSNVC